jgi:Fur family transcriptional regulator, ferric uptake regulator
MNKLSAISRLKEKMRISSIKLTKQRLVICEMFFAQSGHMRAEEILQEARAKNPNVSLATVYRTLKLLQEYGFAKSHNFQDGQALFEPCFDKEDHHDHLICTKCGRIMEFIDQEIESLQIRIASEHGFIITNHKMELYGLCEKCQK